MLIICIGQILFIGTTPEMKMRCFLVELCTAVLMRLRWECSVINGARNERRNAHNDGPPMLRCLNYVHFDGALSQPKQWQDIFNVCISALTFVHFQRRRCPLMWIHISADNAKASSAYRYKFSRKWSHFQWPWGSLESFPSMLRFTTTEQANISESMFYKLNMHQLAHHLAEFSFTFFILSRSDIHAVRPLFPILFRRVVY